MRTSKTILMGVIGLSLAAGTGFAAESVPATAVKTAEQPAAQPKYEFFNADKYTGKLGKITLPYEGTSSLLLRKVQNGKLGDFLVVQGKEQSVGVPVGTYRLMNYSLTVTDEAKGKWTIYGGPTSEAKARLIEVKEGGSIRLQTGEPLTASIKVTEAGSNVNMSFQMIGSNGDKCTIMRVDGKAEQPGFQVLSASGDVLMSGNFAYG